MQLGMNGADKSCTLMSTSRKLDLYSLTRIDPDRTLLSALLIARAHRPKMNDVRTDQVQVCLLVVTWSESSSLNDTHGRFWRFFAPPSLNFRPTTSKLAAWTDLDVLLSWVVLFHSEYGPVSHRPLFCPNAPLPSAKRHKRRSF